MAGTWADLVKQPGASVDTMLLLTDGSVIAHESDSPNWHRLAPDAKGSYTKGTWTTLPPMPPNGDVPASAGGPTYGPLFFGSAVLGDGTVLVIGGEYNTGVTPAADVAAATRFDPVTSTWANVTTPSGWSQVGDPPLCVLADGRVLVGDLNSAQTALFDPVAGTFGAGPSKGDRCAEESFVLLPDDTVLAVDCSSIPNAEKFVPSSNTWVSAGSTPTALPQSCPGIVAEIGPTVLLPNGHAFVAGASGDTATYLPPANPADPGTWQSGPTITDPSGNTMHPIDAPAALLPNGRVLLAAGPTPPCSFPSPTSFFEYDPGTNALAAVSPPPSNAGGPCFTGRMLVLPNGQILFSNQSATVSVYTPDGAPDPAWKPAITAVPAVMAAGHHYLVSGRQFNGLSQASYYGDDATMATNYPIARLHKGATVIYCRTADHSTMGVATGTRTVSTVVSIPAGVPQGVYDLVVVANGIPSDPVPVRIEDAVPDLEVEIQDGGDFGTVCGQGFRTLTLFNVGDRNLIVDRVEAVPATGDFAVLPMPAPPMTIRPGEDVEFVVGFTPTTPGATGSATIRIMSNDPLTPAFDIPVSAVAGIRSLATAVVDGGSFGDVCLGDLRDEPLTLAASGSCPVKITGILSSSASFTPPAVDAYPLTIAPGTAVAVPIRFAPTVHGPSTGDLTILSDAQDGPHTVPVTGLAPAPRLAAVTADDGDFGETCVGHSAELGLVLINSGQCPLTVMSISSSAAEFLPPRVDSYPLVVGAGDSLTVPIRFRPIGFGPADAVITIDSDDPAGPRDVHVHGHAPSGRLAVTGSTCFGEVDCGIAEKTVSICNIGLCDLTVTSVKFRRKRRHFRLVNNPFPATLPPGTCLGVVIRYEAACDPECCELVITSDDPDNPRKCLDVVAYTRCEPSCERTMCRQHSKEGERHCC